MQFKTVDIVKHPIDKVWASFRDELPQLVEWLDDVESITTQSRRETGRRCHIVNRWQVHPNLPAAIMKHVRPEMTAWMDCADWDETRRECRWTIEFDYFRDAISCSGTTRFAPAMGGRGTRITLVGEAHWSAETAVKIPGLLDQAVSRTLEPLLRNLLAANARKISTALATYLDGRQE